MEFHTIFKVVATLLDNNHDNGYKISWQSLQNWLTGYRKANFHFGPSSTVGQTVVYNVGLVYSLSDGGE